MIEILGWLITIIFIIGVIGTIVITYKEIKEFRENPYDRDQLIRRAIPVFTFWFADLSIGIGLWLIQELLKNGSFIF